MAEKKGCVLSEVLRNQVKERFDRLKQALDIREKILLRQVDVLAGHQACKHMMIENIEFLADNEFDMLKRITSFGKFSIKHFQFKNDAACLGVEEYIPSVDDHHEERKSIEHHKGGVHHHCITVGEPLKIPNCTTGVPEEHETHDLHVGYSNNKHRHCSPPSPIRHSHKGKNIRITINETKEDTGCKQQPVTHHHEKQCIDLTTTTTNTTENNRHRFKFCELIGNSAKSKSNKQITIATTTQTSTQTDPHLHPPAPNGAHHMHHQKAGGHNMHSHADKSKVLKNISNLTLSNSSGTINLRNISNLTINNSCNRLKTEKEHIHHPDNDNCPENTECGFYDRLITENKSLQYQLLKNAFGKKVCTPPMASLEHVHIDAMPNPNLNNNKESSPLPHSSSSEHPVQVQQWLKQIVYETETEPLVNAEFMEFINIKR